MGDYNHILDGRASFNPTPSTLEDTDGLTLEERALLNALMVEPSFKKAARRAGMATITARKIFNTREPFRKAYNELYGNVKALIRRFNETVVPDALERLEELIHSTDEDVALKAIRTILQIAGTVDNDTPKAPVFNILNNIQVQRETRGLPPLVTSAQSALAVAYSALPEPQTEPQSD